MTLICGMRSVLIPSNRKPLLSMQTNLVPYFECLKPNQDENQSYYCGWTNRSKLFWGLASSLTVILTVSYELDAEENLDLSNS